MGTVRRIDHYRHGDLVFDVTDTGPTDGPVVVLLHGFPQFPDCWTAVVERLSAQGYRCLAPAQRGYSAGARPKGRRAYRARELVADVVALIDALGAENVHLVGHDFGAAVAWGVAAYHPDRVTTLATLSVPHPQAFVQALVTSRQIVASWYIFGFQVPAVPEFALLGPGARRPDRLARMLTDRGQSADAAQRDAQAMAASGALGPAMNWYRALPWTKPTFFRRKVNVPTMFVWSDGDTAVKQKGAHLCGDWVTGPYRFEVLRGVSHWMLDEVPDQVSDLLLEHFDEHGP